MEKSLTDLESRLTRLEQAISQDPARALEIPLLRKDFDNLENTQDTRLSAIQESIAQVYDL